MQAKKKKSNNKHRQQAQATATAAQAAEHKLRKFCEQKTRKFFVSRKFALNIYSYVINSNQHQWRRVKTKRF